MTLTLIAHVNKRILYNLLATLDYKKIMLALILPFSNYKFQAAPKTSLVSCTCCGWKGEELKTRKHYLEVEGIAELELYCPKCNQYLCFISEPVPTGF